MTTHKGIAPLAVLVVIGVAALVGGGAYVALNQEAKITTPTEESQVQTTPEDRKEIGYEADARMHSRGEPSISWRLEAMGEDAYGMPRTKVTATVNGIAHTMGTFNGSCAEIGASGGIDGKGLLAGELSAVQCFYAGGGDEIGVFAHEDGGYQIMVGTLDEGNAETKGVRGNFKIEVDIKP